MQNCFEVVHLLNDDKYQTIFIKIVANEKLPFKTRNKMLELIQVWAEGLRSYPHLRPHNNYFRTYSHLKNRGTRFPPTTGKYTPPTADMKGEDDAIPPELLVGHASSAGASAAPSHSSLSSEDAEKFSLVQSQIDLLTDVFANIDPKVENIRTNEIVNEVLPGLIDFSRQLRFNMEAGRVPEDIFAIAIDVNDKIVVLQQQHQDLLQGKRPAIQRAPPASKPPPKLTAFDLIGQSSAAPIPSSSSGFLNLPAPPSPTRSPSPFHGAAEEKVEDDIMAEFERLANREPPRQQPNSSSSSSHGAQPKQFFYGPEDSLI
jgi:hypothetical protein